MINTESGRQTDSQKARINYRLWVGFDFHPSRTASNFEQVADTVRVDANSASYP